MLLLLDFQSASLISCAHRPFRSKVCLNELIAQDFSAQNDRDELRRDELYWDELRSGRTVPGWTETRTNCAGQTEAGRTMRDKLRCSLTVQRYLHSDGKIRSRFLRVAHLHLFQTLPLLQWSVPLTRIPQFDDAQLKKKTRNESRPFS